MLKNKQTHNLLKNIAYNFYKSSTIHKGYVWLQ